MTGEVLFKMQILDRIEFRPEPGDLLARIGPGMETVVELPLLAAQALTIARPRACFSLVPVEDAGSDRPRLGGRTFESLILGVNLKDSREAGLFVATCGTELERWAESFEDMLLRWIAETVCEMALSSAVRFVEDELDRFLPGPYHATMNPGSLPDWPLEQQAGLFGVLDGVGEAIGVTLTPSFLMRPRKSVSGVRFASKTAYSNCRLCPRDDCPGRRMPYDEMEYAMRYGHASPGTDCCTGTFG